MINDFPYFEKADVGGLTRAELDAAADLVDTPGWAVVKKYLAAITAPVLPAVYTNTDPDKQLLLHQGIGRIYVAANLVEFVSSAIALRVTSIHHSAAPAGLLPESYTASS